MPTPSPSPRIEYGAGSQSSPVQGRGGRGESQLALVRLAISALLIFSSGIARLICHARTRSMATEPASANTPSSSKRSSKTEPICGFDALSMAAHELMYQLPCALATCFTKIHRLIWTSGVLDCFRGCDRAPCRGWIPAFAGMTEVGDFCFRGRPEETRAFPKLLNTAEGGLMAWLRDGWGTVPGAGIPDRGPE